MSHGRTGVSCVPYGPMGVEAEGATMMPVKRVIARDRRRAAIHEAGHLVIAEHVGLRCGLARIFPNPEPLAGLFEKTWLGQVSYRPCQHVSTIKCRMVAVAGAVA